MAEMIRDFYFEEDEDHFRWKNASHRKVLIALILIFYHLFRHLAQGKIQYQLHDKTGRHESTQIGIHSRFLHLLSLVQS